MQQQHNKGIALIIAIVLSALLVGVAATIGSLVGRDILLSSSSTESARALAMADIGIECALEIDFQDTANKPFATSSTVDFISCAGDVVDLQRPQGTMTRSACLSNPHNPCGCDFDPLASNDPTPGAEKRAFWFGDRYKNSDACGCVEVGKRYETVNGSQILITEIESRGYNTCDPADPGRVERALRATF